MDTLSRVYRLGLFTEDGRGDSGKESGRELLGALDRLNLREASLIIGVCR